MARKSQPAKDLKAKLSLSRIMNAADGPRIRVEVEDSASGTCFLEMEMSAETLGLVLTGASYQDVDVSVRGFDLLGMKHENKTVTIEIGDDCPWESEKFRAYMLPRVAPFEVDGWKASEYDLQSMNHHRREKGGGKKTYAVAFFRYVDPVTKKPVS